MTKRDSGRAGQKQAKTGSFRTSVGKGAAVLSKKKGVVVHERGEAGAFTFKPAIRVKRQIDVLDLIGRRD